MRIIIPEPYIMMTESYDVSRKTFFIALALKLL